MNNPYKGLKDYQFWRRAVSTVEFHALNPVVAPKFKITRSEKVATAGSCFAQHISRRLQGIGFNYYIPDYDSSLSAEELRVRGYGMFSARYGNIYTVRQLLQLFDEAFGHRAPTEQPWLREDGRYVDPFRPNIEPNGFTIASHVHYDREKHLGHVRDMFLNADVFVFTLGLTEGWLNKAGDVFPLAPGVSGGDYSTDHYDFKNFSVNEVTDDLRAFLEKLKAANPKVKVILTVSPVPLIATFENRHVLVSTTYSKSVLRVAAGMAEQEYDWVDYFPSYEIITGNFNGGQYYEQDLREVNKTGVSHAMRCFMSNYVDNQSQNPEQQDTPMDVKFRHMAEVVCDEESIAKVSM